MPYAQFHYPFENKDKFNKNFPAEFISESDDQIRLWFYTMFVLGVALFDKSPFKNVLVTGMLGDEKGKKMSKSSGNYPPIEEVFNEYGSDMLRYFLLTGGIARGLPTAFSYELLKETKKELFTMLWNSYKYYVTYANLANHSGGKIEESDNILDTWVLARLKQLVLEINTNLENYEVMNAARLFAPFVQDLSTWYIRRARDRISAGEDTALNTLYTCLLTLSKLLAPFTPFLADELYINLTKGDQEESVHLTSFPVAKSLSNAEVEVVSNMQVVRDTASVGNAIRKEANIPVRQPLAELKVKTDIPQNLLDLLQDELNVKKVTTKQDLPEQSGWVTKEGVSLNVDLTNELKIEGALRNLVRQVQDLRKEKGLSVEDKITLKLESTEENKNIVSNYENDLKEKVGAVKVEFSDTTTVIKS
jgi:isoleucyl-tRNA synthetase